MLQVKTFFIKIIPYLLAFLFGIVLFFSSPYFDGEYRNLVVNLSANFIGIPLIFIVYELAQKIIHRKATKEIFDYAKIQADRGILSVINQLQKTIYPYDVINHNLDEINEFLQLDKEAVAAKLLENQYLGFQLLKKWDSDENYFHEILKNSFILSKLDDDHIISLIKLLKNIRALNSIEKSKIIYPIESVATNFKVASGNNFNERNKESYPDRLLLLRELPEGKYLVVDFGDFYGDANDKLLRFHKYKKDSVLLVAGLIYDTITEINNWLSITGEEFLIDTKMFKVRATNKIV